MKSVSVFLLTFLFSLLVQAQQDVRLPGVVVEQNSAFNTGTVKYLSNAQIKSVGANPQFSDAKGLFTLVFADKPFGNVARVYASKNDYELVNEEELKKAAVLGRTSRLKVVMCKEGQLYENQLAYYQIAKDVSQQAYQERLKILERAGKEQDILIAEMQVEFNQSISTVNQAKELLYQQLVTAQQRAKDLADKFLAVNLDDQSLTYQNAFRAFLAKDIDAALSILDSVDLKQRLATNTAATIKEENLIDTLQSSVAKRKEQIQQDINQCLFKARLYILKYQFIKAEEMFELALQYQPDDSELIFEYAVFLQKQNRFKKARSQYEEALKIYRTLADNNPDVYLQYVAITLNNLGNLSSDNNEMSLAKKQYEEAIKIYKILTSKFPQAYLFLLSSTLNNLGNLLKANKEIVSAKLHFEEALKIRRNLVEKNPDVYLYSLSTTLNNLGILLLDNKENVSAKLHFEESLKIRRSLAEKNPDVYLPDVATTLNNFGNLSRDNQELMSAKLYFEEALSIRRSLAEKNPDVYLPNVATTLNNLGLLLMDDRKLISAKFYFEEALSIRRSLAEKNPDVYLPDVATTLNNLGLLFTKKNEMTLAKYYLEEALKIRRNLAKKNPDAYLPDVAKSLINLGNLLKKHNENIKAKIQYQEALDIYKKLKKTDKNEYILSFIHNNLGLLLKDSDEIVLAKYHLEKALKIRRGLAKKNPDAYLPDIAKSLINLGNLLRKYDETIKAKIQYQEALEITKELADSNPEVYGMNVINTTINIGLFYQELLENNGNMQMKTEGIALMKDAQNRLAIYSKEHPTVVKYKSYIEYLMDFFSN